MIGVGLLLEKKQRSSFAGSFMRSKITRIDILRTAAALLCSMAGDLRRHAQDAGKAKYVAVTCHYRHVNLGVFLLCLLPLLIV